ncbi:MAG: helix-turn-helix domain-containing protein [Chloroflexi bacterium]|nr:helix-turn-helix domain-containing protein [Chloroflexota bacterium]
MSSILSSPPTPHLLTATEAAMRLGLPSRYALHRAVRAGRLRPIARVGARRMLLFAPEDVERAAARHGGS